MSQQHTDDKRCWCHPRLLTIDRYGLEEWRHNEVEPTPKCECEEHGRGKRCCGATDEDL